MVDRRKIGRFEIQRALGRASGSALYQARDTEHGRAVALKTIPFPPGVSPRDRQDLEQRFLDSGRKAAALSHPGIVGLYEVGIDADAAVFFLAFELLRGQTLSAVLATSPPAWRQAVRFVSDAAEAVQHAHEQGVIHGNLSPNAIVIVPPDKVRVADFGLFGWEAPPPSAAVVADSYMSPERALGKPVDRRTDVYSLGAILYELLAHQPVVQAASAIELTTRIAYEKPAPVRSRARDLPETMDAVLALALAKTPEARHTDARSLREDLADLLSARTPRHAGSAGVGTARSDVLAPSPLALPLGQSVSVEIREGLLKGEAFVLEKPRFLIGRAGGGAQADLELQDPEISRAHALVECHATRIVLRDLDSTNGTFLGSARITEAELVDGSEFRVGQTAFRLRVVARDDESK